MPYAQDRAGIYRVVDRTTGTCYVGQSRRLRKRIAEHFRLLGLRQHPNPHLQAAYDRAGPDALHAEIEVYCDDPHDLDLLEEAFLSGEAHFDTSPGLFNISSTARAPMSGRSHTGETRARISAKKKGQVAHVTDAYRAKLSAAHLRRLLGNPEFAARVKFVVQNPDLSYAERGRRIGLDTSSTRKLALRYAPLKEILDG